MQDERFIVKYISVNTCFAYLPEKWLRRLTLRQRAICMRHENVDYYLSWFSYPGPDSEALCLGATFARNLNINEGDTVFVTNVDEAPALTSIIVSPKSSQDRVMLDLQIDNVQANLLNQVRVVAKDQPIVAWTSKYNYILLQIKSLHPPFKYGQLENLTEIHVAEALNPKNSLGNHIFDTFPRFSKRPTTTLSYRVYRAHPFPRKPLYITKSESDEMFKSPFCVYIREKLLVPGMTNNSLWKIRKVKEDRQHVKQQFKSGNNMGTTREFVVIVRIAEDSVLKLRNTFSQIENYFIPLQNHDNINVTHDLMSNLRMKIGGKVMLQPIAESSTVDCTAIEIYPHESSISADTFRNFIIRNSGYSKMLLNSQATVTLEDGTRCLVKLMPSDCTYGLFDEEVLNSIEIRVSDAASIEDSRPAEETNEDQEEDFMRNIAFDVVIPIIDECKNTLILSLDLHNIINYEYDRDNVLVSGVPGSGKTTICKLLIDLFRDLPYFVHTRYIDCKSLKGKKAEVIQKFFMTEISHAVYYQPTILLLDDIDGITGVSSIMDEKSADAMNAARVTDVIFNIVTQHQRRNSITVVATCTDATKVGQKLREARGVHFFRTLLTIPPLEKADRINILRTNLKNKLNLAKNIDWEYYGNTTEGWVIQDLVLLAEKAAFTAWKQHVKKQSRASLILQDSDFKETLSRYTPLSLQGINLYKGEGHTWSDIGGLADVKRTLVEILHWPLKYPNIFKEAPIKLQSGILLYGMPGTGKTMLAGAIAKECGLNFISVKGPELLSKYIGASEEAVRNVFEKARRAKPCVVFFDEFDSLAPKRGHDSTGVTDRVVNQLLTHLDGIEGREGVAVVAASSRPDLIDPALLRPGRLDKALLCPLPDENDREEILESLCRTHGMDSNELDLKVIAGMTSDFTGADLNAILKQARLDVIEEAMKSCSEEMKKHLAEVKVTQNDLLNALKSSKTSLLDKEKQKYKRIYERFGKRGSSVVNDVKHQKATLA